MSKYNKAKVAAVEVFWWKFFARQFKYRHVPCKEGLKGNDCGRQVDGPKNNSSIPHVNLYLRAKCKSSYFLVENWNIKISQWYEENQDKKNFWKLKLLWLTDVHTRVRRKCSKTLYENILRATFCQHCREIWLS